MKRKFIMPLVAIVFGVLSAFASIMPPQQAWFKAPLSNPAQGAITSPSDTHVTACGATGQNICKVGDYNAYDSYDNANAQLSQGLMKRN